MPDALAFVSLTAAIRAHCGLSVRQLGRWLGVSAGFVAHIETGRRGLPPPWPRACAFDSLMSCRDLLRHLRVLPTASRWNLYGFLVDYIATNHA